MNSQIMVGVGNIYACEALYQAKIHPQKNVQKISLNKYKTLGDEIISVLKKAIKQGGTTSRILGP